MKNRWNDSEAQKFIHEYGEKWGNDLALRTYSSRLIGADHELVLHGGGNTSVKTTVTNIYGEQTMAVFVKASGRNLETIEPEGHPGLDLDPVAHLRTLDNLSDDRVLNELLRNSLNARDAAPSIETLTHAFLPPVYIDHTHADAILALTNQPGGEKIVREALGDDVIIVDYVRPGFALAKTVADAYDSNPDSVGMVLMKHGLVTWGISAEESYKRHIDLVTKAETYIERKIKGKIPAKTSVSKETALERFTVLAPVLRGLLALETGDHDKPYKRCIIKPIINEEILAFLESENSKQIFVSPALTTDHLIRTKSLPLWIDEPDYKDEDVLKEQISRAIGNYAKSYDAYMERHAERLSREVNRFDSRPRVILIPGLGAVCAGRDADDAVIVRDITLQTLRVKARIAAMGSYEGLSEDHLFDMEYLPLQHMKLVNKERPLQRMVALITGAAGAIGFGICQKLLEHGCHVAVTDLPGDHLDSMKNEVAPEYVQRFMTVPLDVTDRQSVIKAFRNIISHWGGIDLVIVNAGIAHVSSLADMDLESFRKLERVNVEGTLNVLSETARHLKKQGTGGDVVVISTKNVFCPGANFGAYSATKAASHQLARIASLELAGIGVRVNMVSPDAVFSHGARRSGLWNEVGPDRMKARGLDEQGLEDYYRNRNLLKTKVTATHVANAVYYFASRQSPTTGATIPVDGGLPDSTPR